MIQEQPRKFFDQRIQAESVFVQAGHHHVQNGGPGAICTFLGSCVAACIRDSELGIGGLNHFLLPTGGNGDQSARYGVNAMELLINDILRLGATKERLEAKIFGGASVMATSSADPIGQQNGRFVQQYLNDEGIPILATDLGGTRARRVYFFPETGRASILHVAPADSQEVERKDAELRKQATNAASPGGVELF